MAHEQFWKLLEPEHSAAQRFCRRLSGDSNDGDDVYQDGLVTALMKFRTLKNPDAFRAWLYRILINRYKNGRRNPDSRRHQNLDEAAMADYTSDPACELTARRWLERAYRALKPDDKALVVLHELEGWTVCDLANALNLREGTVKARLSRSRRKMRRAIERTLPDEDTILPKRKAMYAVWKEPE